MKWISTDDQLPNPRVYVLWWHPITGSIRLGPFYEEEGRYAPGYFRGEGAWYVCDGPTYWMPLPDPPCGPNKSLHLTGLPCEDNGPFTELDDEYAGVADFEEPPRR